MAISSMRACCRTKTLADRISPKHILHGRDRNQTFVSNRRQLTVSPQPYYPLAENFFRPYFSFFRQFSVSSSLAAEKKSFTLKKPVTPKGKFDLEDEAKKRELDQIREELRLKEEAEKKEEEEKEKGTQNDSMGELINEVTGERGGPKGQEPTEYGDWQRKGRVTDF